MKSSLPLRKDVPIKKTWNLESIFPNVIAWENAYQDVETRIPVLAKFQGRLAKDPKILLKYLDLANEISILAMKVMVYGSLEQSTDMGDSAATARAGQGRTLAARVNAARSFEIPELLTIGSDILSQWTNEEPGLAIYKHYFNDLDRQSHHYRSVEVEEILAMVSEPLPESTPPAYSALVNAELPFQPAVDSKGRKHEIGQSSITALLAHKDRTLRQTAFDHYANAYLQFKNTIAAIQTQAFQRDSFLARARNYASSLDASLAPHNIPPEVFHSLINVFKQNLHIWQKYWQVRREALGYDILHVSDIKAPLTPKIITIPFDQAVDWICEGMAPLGEEYVHIMRRGCLEDRWVDRAINKGKRQGAFSWGSYDTQPFIMMSYADDVFSLSTLAHELGHSMHSYYTRKFQPYIYGRYSLFVAEVASNFNQAMVRDYLFRTQTDSAFQLALIEEALSNFHRYFFIMPTLARWELEMHTRVEKGGPTNAKIYTDRCAELFMEGYGDQVAYDHDRIGITWAQFGHMYMNFYVYQYATGISGAHALVDQVMTGGPQAAMAYLDFLKTGNAKYPIDALIEAGVDLTSPKPVVKAFGVLTQIVDHLESIVKEGIK